MFHSDKYFINAPLHTRLKSYKIYGLQEFKDIKTNNKKNLYIKTNLEIFNILQYKIFSF